MTAPCGPLALSIAEYVPWSPETPVLYTLHCELHDGERKLDTRSVRFGMRELTLKESRFFLNNRPIHVRGFIPGPQPPANPAALRRMGWNLVHLAADSLDPAVLDAADDSGLMIWAGLRTGVDAACVAVETHRNRACIVAWETPMDDTFCRRIRELDPTRLIVSGCGEAGRTRVPARLIRPYRDEAESIEEVQAWPRMPLDGRAEAVFASLGDAGHTTYLSSLGDGPLPGQDDKKFQAGYRERGLDNVFDGPGAMIDAARAVSRAGVQRAFDLLRANPKCAGYSYRPAGPDWETWSGESADRALRDDIRPVIHMSASNLVPRQDVPVTIGLINEPRIEGRGELSLQVVGPTNQVLWKKRRSAKIPRHGRELWEGSVGASGSHGTHRLLAQIYREGVRAGENEIEFHVFEPAQTCDIAVNLVDPQGRWAERVRAFVKPSNLQAPVHVIPPMADTIRAYPDNELGHILGQVREGAVAIAFQPPADWNDLADLIDPGLRATSLPDLGSSAFHYAKLHPVFDYLPARGVMGDPYAGVLPLRSFAEMGDEDISGCYDPVQAAWGNNILVRRYGSGRIVFTHLRVLDSLATDPVAAHLFVNLVKHFARRSVPTGGILPVHQPSVEWLRREATTRIRKWMAIGPFPNPGGTGHSTEFPPEAHRDFQSPIEMAHGATPWTAHHTRADQGHRLDFREALPHPLGGEIRYSAGTAYAYAEFAADTRSDAIARVGTQDPTKMWLNGNLVFESKESHGPDYVDYRDAGVFVKQGRNTLLAKVSAGPGPFGFSLEFNPGRDPLAIKWWK